MQSPYGFSSSPGTVQNILYYLGNDKTLAGFRVIGASGWLGIPCSYPPPRKADVFSPLLLWVHCVQPSLNGWLFLQCVHQHSLHKFYLRAEAILVIHLARFHANLIAHCLIVSGQSFSYTSQVSGTNNSHPQISLLISTLFNWSPRGNWYSRHFIQ